MKRIAIFLTGVILFVSGCGDALYYGYLPGTDYKYFKPIHPVDLKGRSFTLDFTDARANHSSIACSGQIVDRQTELEGKLGITYFKQYATSMIEQCHGKVVPQGGEQITMDLEVISFTLIGAGYILPHGLVQFRARTNSLNKVYCTDMTDHDNDSPMKWYSFQTRRSGSRLIVSGAMRRTLEEFNRDLEKKDIPH